MDQDISRERTKNYIRQLKGSFVFKLLAVGASFLAVPVMIHYLGQEQFGVWSTLLSMISWVVFFDFGIGTGLRNKLAESLANSDPEEAGHYVSSAYSLIGLISLGLFVLVAIACFFIPWQSVFNTKAISEQELRHVVLLTAAVITINFWIGLINQVLEAVQRASVVVLGQCIANILALAGVYILSLTTDASLFYLALAYGVSLVVANILLSFSFYRERYELVPEFFLDRTHIRPLLSLGGQFFLIQLAVIVIFTTDKILITQLFGPQYVTQYDVVFKLFGVVLLAHAMISTPLWSAYTDAYHRGDFNWIKATLRQQLWVMGIMCVAAMVMLVVAKPAIALWVGGDIEIPMPLVMSMAAFTVVSVWNGVFAFMVNGCGKLKLQMMTALVGMLANIPLTLLLVKHFGFGVEGVVWATVLSLLPFALLGPIQVYFLLQREPYEAS